MSRRDDALNALRNWSEPGKRDRLIREAWMAGETNVAVLAEAARCARQTVYTSLHRSGIDPDARGKGKIMQERLVIEGLNGDIDDLLDDSPIARAVLAHHQNPSEETQAEKDRLMSIHGVLMHYNKAVPLLNAEAELCAERDRTRHLVDMRWEELGNLRASDSWLSAHHRYRESIAEARLVIEAWAVQAEKVKSHALIPEKWQALYQQVIVDAGHPPLVIPTVLDADKFYEDLDCVTAERDSIVQETASLLSR